MFTATEAKCSGLLVLSLHSLILVLYPDFLQSSGSSSDFNDFMIYAKEYADS